MTIRLRGYTETTPEERRQFLNALSAVMGRPGPASRERTAQAQRARKGLPVPSGTPGCPCGVIYSRCYYPVTHTAPWC